MTAGTRGPAGEPARAQARGRGGLARLAVAAGLQRGTGVARRRRSPASRWRGRTRRLQPSPVTSGTGSNGFRARAPEISLAALQAGGASGHAAWVCTAMAPARQRPAYLPIPHGSPSRPAGDRGDGAGTGWAVGAGARAGAGAIGVAGAGEGAGLTGEAGAGGAPVPGPFLAAALGPRSWPWPSRWRRMAWPGRGPLSMGARATMITPAISARIAVACKAIMPGDTRTTSPKTTTPSNIPATGSAAVRPGREACTGPALNALSISQRPIRLAAIMLYACQLVSTATKE